jgi:hypothetical protein
VTVDVGKGRSDDLLGDPCHRCRLPGRRAVPLPMRRPWDCGQWRPFPGPMSGAASTPSLWSARGRSPGGRATSSKLSGTSVGFGPPVR